MDEQQAEVFTPEQIAMYVAFEKVRQSGHFNMFDPQAKRASKLGEDAYFFVMKNFSALRKQHEAGA